MKSLDKADLLIVGAGFFGTTIARLAAEDGFRCVVIDRRNHFGGNSYSYTDQKSGVEVHQYGSHLFHTSNDQVWSFVNRFSEFNSYVHRVFTVHEDQVFSMPINLHTIGQFYGRVMSPDDAAATIKRDGKIPHPGKPRNLEEKAIESVGRPLYEALIRGYTRKQWNRDPSDLPASTISRLPVRFNYDSRYFNDKWEGLPVNGYGELFRRMLDHPFITVQLQTDFSNIRGDVEARLPVVYTGPIDEYFDYRHGSLSWRTLDFEFETRRTEDFQGAAVINFADPNPSYTRTHEFKHLHPESGGASGFSVLAHEFSREASVGDEPYYPVNTEKDRTVLDCYRKDMSQETNTVFGGRLGSYQYLDMHMAIASAFSRYESRVSPLLQANGSRAR